MAIHRPCRCWPVAIVLAALVSPFSANSAENDPEVTVAVASNFKAPMDAIASAFMAQTGYSVTLVYGSSGRLFAQIVNGAPFDVLLSADQDKPQRLEQQGLAVSGSRFTYAVGTLVLWSPDPSLIVEGVTVLQEGNYQRLAIANPRLAPYGEAATEVLQSLGLLELTRPRWVMGENIAQTYLFVSSGNAGLGFVALSQVQQQGRIPQGSFWIVPANMHSAIRQDAVLLERGSVNLAAQELIQYLQSVPVQLTLESFGYRPPSE